MTKKEIALKKSIIARAQANRAYIKARDACAKASIAYTEANCAYIEARDAYEKTKKETVTYAKAKETP